MKSNQNGTELNTATPTVGLTVFELATELSLSGWPNNRKLLILAARFYKGLETVETLRLANLPARDINCIIYMR